MRVLIWSHWHPNSNGTDYLEALGIYPDLKAAHEDGIDYACQRYEWPSEAEQEEEGIEAEGPEVVLYDYDSDPKEHDRHRAGGGSFADDFVEMTQDGAR